MIVAIISLLCLLSYIMINYHPLSWPVWYYMLLSWLKDGQDPSRMWLLCCIMLYPCQPCQPWPGQSFASACKCSLASRQRRFHLAGYTPALQTLEHFGTIFHWSSTIFNSVKTDLVSACAVSARSTAGSTGSKPRPGVKQCIVQVLAVSERRTSHGARRFARRFAPRWPQPSCKLARAGWRPPAWPAQPLPLRPLFKNNFYIYSDVCVWWILCIWCIWCIWCMYIYIYVCVSIQSWNDHIKCPCQFMCIYISLYII